MLTLTTTLESMSKNKINPICRGWLRSLLWSALLFNCWRPFLYPIYL